MKHRLHDNGCFGIGRPYLFPHGGGLVFFCAYWLDFSHTIAHGPLARRHTDGPSTSLLFVLYGAALSSPGCFSKTTKLSRLSIHPGLDGHLLSLLLLILSLLGVQQKAEYLGMNISGVVGGAPVGPRWHRLTALCFVIIGRIFLLAIREGRRALAAFWSAAAWFWSA